MDCFVTLFLWLKSSSLSSFYVLSTLMEHLAILSTFIILLQGVSWCYLFFLLTWPHLFYWFAFFQISKKLSIWPFDFYHCIFPPSMSLWWDFFSDIYRWLSVSRNSFWLSLQYLSLAPQVGYILIMGKQRDTLFIPNQLPHLLPVLSAPASFQHFWSSLTLPPVFSYLNSVSWIPANSSILEICPYAK